MKMLTDQQIDYHAARVIANDHDWQEHLSVIIAQAKLVYSIQQTAAECGKDAERYSFIRAEHDRIDPICRVSWKMFGQRNSPDWVNLSSGEQLDTEIDAAIAAAKEK